MYDFNDLIKQIKKLSVEAVNSTKPTAIVYGKVISNSPLQINVEQKMTLTVPHLVLTRNVTDYEIKITVDHTTEYTSGGSGEDAFSSHNHEYKGEKNITIHNRLNVGDEVIMIQVQGGQKYVVLDRVII